jgi:maleylpyruvate isomerase
MYPAPAVHSVDDVTVSVEVVERPSRDIEGCRVAHARLTELVSDLAPEVVRGPSLLPGWSVGHVLTHLARNADAMFRRVDAAPRGVVVEQYVGGPPGRAAEINAGAERPPQEILADAVESAARLDALFARVPDVIWGCPVRTVAGEEHPAGRLPFRRWREVEVHLVDLGLDFVASDWSQELVDRALPSLLHALPSRADRHTLMAWLIGRGSPPELSPWA